MSLPKYTRRRRRDTKKEMEQMQNARLRLIRRKRSKQRGTEEEVMATKSRKIARSVQAPDIDVLV
jgi:hypothetical protein